MNRRFSLILKILILGFSYFISTAIVGSFENPGNSDFFSFWLSGHLVATQQNPYSAYDWVKGHHLFNSNWISDLTFLYPLPLSILFVPLSLLSIKQAFIIWVSISIILLLINVNLILNYFRSEKKYFIIPVLGGMILFRPLVSLFTNGQLSAVFFLIFIVTVLLWEKNQWFWGGVLLGFSLLKPNLGIILLGLSGMYLLKQHKYNAIIGIGTSGLLLALIGFLINPSWIDQYISILLAKHNVTFGYNPTIWGLTHFLTNFDAKSASLIGIGICAILLLVYFLIINKLNSNTPSIVFGLIILIMLTTTPYLWPYDQIYLIFPIILTMWMARKLGVPYIFVSVLFILISIVSYFLFWISIKMQMENINGLITIIVLFIYVFTIFSLQKNKMLSTTIDTNQTVVQMPN